MKFDDLPDIFDVKLLATYFNCGINTAYKVAGQPGFPSFKVRGCTRIRKDGLKTWMEKQEDTPSYTPYKPRKR